MSLLRESHFVCKICQDLVKVDVLTTTCCSLRDDAFLLLCGGTKIILCNSAVYAFEHLFEHWMRIREPRISRFGHIPSRSFCASVDSDA